MPKPFSRRRLLIGAAPVAAALPMARLAWGSDGSGAAALTHEGHHHQALDRTRRDVAQQAIQRSLVEPTVLERRYQRQPDAADIGTGALTDTGRMRRRDASVHFPLLRWAGGGARKNPVLSGGVHSISSMRVRYAQARINGPGEGRFCHITTMQSSARMRRVSRSLRHFVNRCQESWCAVTMGHCPDEGCSFIVPGHIE